MRLRNVRFIATLALGILLAPLAAEAQQPAKVPRIGIIAPGHGKANQPVFWVRIFRQALHDLGWVEGQNIVIEYRWEEGITERLAEHAAELARIKVDVVYAPYTPAALAAKQATKMIPIVFVGGTDPVGAELVASLARPGGNITGLTSTSPELSSKRLELLKELVPRVSRVGVFGDLEFPETVHALKELEVAARSLGLALQPVDLRDPTDLERAFETVRKRRADGLIVLRSPITVIHRVQIVTLATESGLAAMYDGRMFVVAGGLISYGANLSELHRRAAAFVDKILKGAKPGDLPVEQPTKFELVINLKTAKTLGLTIPQSILIRADQVIR